MADRKIRVVIADDHPPQRQMIARGLMEQENYEVVGVAEDGMETLEMVYQLQPDVLILDIIMPKKDGMSVLKQIAGASLEVHPEVIMISAMANEDIVRRSIALGARYYMIKPFEVEQLIERIGEITNVSDEPGENVAISAADVAPQKGKTLDEEISSIFLVAGIPAHIKGFHYLREGIRLVVEEPDMINRITKELYPSIARRFQTSPSKVERAIRHAIEVAWSRGRIEHINQLFGYNVYTKTDKPTNGEFIALIADKILLERSA